MLRENWYAVHVLSQYENKVKSYIDKVKKEHGYEDKVSEVVIPVDTEVKRVNGKKVEKKNKVFPGYILIRMKLDDDSYNHRKNMDLFASLLRKEVYNIDNFDFSNLQKKIKFKIRDYKYYIKKYINPWNNKITQSDIIINQLKKDSIWI